MAKRSLKPIHFVLAAIAVCAALVAGFVWFQRRSPKPAQSGTLSQQQIQTLAAQLASLQKKEADLNETVWKNEVQAEECGHIFEELWDALNGATNKLALAATVPLRELLPPKLTAPKKFAHEITLYESDGANPKWNNA